MFQFFSRWTTMILTSTDGATGRKAIPHGRIHLQLDITFDNSKLKRAKRRQELHVCLLHNHEHNNHLSWHNLCTSSHAVFGIIKKNSSSPSCFMRLKLLEAACRVNQKSRSSMLRKTSHREDNVKYHISFSWCCHHIYSPYGKDPDVLSYEFE